jgi:hypothetical protein
MIRKDKPNGKKSVKYEEKIMEKTRKYTKKNRVNTLKGTKDNSSKKCIEKNKYQEKERIHTKKNRKHK